MEGKLCADLLPPEPTKRGRGMPHTPFRQVVKRLLDVLSTDCHWCDIPRGPQWAAKSAAHRWRQRWHADGTLAALPAPLLGLAEERGLMRWHYGAVDGAFSLWQRRRRGGRVWPERPGDPHSLTDAAGMPLSARTTPGNGDERAQVIPLLDALYLRRGKRGRPRQRVKVQAAGIGDDAKELRHRLRQRGILPRSPNGYGQPESRVGAP
ncbi:MAG TPA: transposase [Candidatus Tectomicrobia bacterium]